MKNNHLKVQLFVCYLTGYNVNNNTECNNKLL